MDKEKPVGVRQRRIRLSPKAVEVSLAEKLEFLKLRFHTEARKHAYVEGGLSVLLTFFPDLANRIATEDDVPDITYECPDTGECIEYTVLSGNPVPHPDGQGYVFQYRNDVTGDHMLLAKVKTSKDATDDPESLSEDAE